MKWLLLVLVGIGAIGGGVWLKTNTSNPAGILRLTKDSQNVPPAAQEQAQNQTNQEGKLVSGPLKCTRTMQNTSATSVSYITDTHIRSDAAWGNEQHSLIIDIASMKMHSWSRSAKGSRGSIINVSETLLRDTIMGIFAETTSAPGCAPWKEDSSVFIPPADISFVDAVKTQELLKQSQQ